MLIPAMRRYIPQVDAYDSPSSELQAATCERIYQLGNNPHHAWIYEEAMRTPGVAVLHDVVLHHLIVR